MRLSSSISSKGQVTVPLEIRERLGLKTGDRVEFVIDGERTLVRPARNRKNPFLEYVGALSVFGSVDEVNEWVAELRDDE